MSVSDNFNRSNSSTLGVNWTDTQNVMRISGNSARPTTDSVYHFCRYTGVSWGNDHTTQALLSVGGADMELTVRHQAGGNLYLMMVHPSVLRIYKYVGGSFTQLGSNLGAGVATAGHTYKLEATGSSPTSLKAYDNGVQIGSTITDSDAALQSGGGPGIGGAHSSGAWDDWVGTGEVAPTTLTSLTESLVDWWDLAEASGNATGAHNGTVLTQTGGTIGTGTVGGRAARDFERSSTQYFIAADSTVVSLDTNLNFTLACRVQFEDVSVNQVIIGKDNNSGTDREFILHLIVGTGIRFTIWDSGSATASVTWGTFPSVGVPYTIVCWHDGVGDVVGISINDATPVTSAAVSGTRDTVASFQLGAGAGIGSNTFDGLIGTLAFWRRVITSGEITSFYNAGAGINYANITPTFSTNLMAFWELDNVNDAHGANTLTNIGTTTFVAGKVGNAANFNGSSQRLEIADNAAISSGDIDYSIQIWFKADTLSSTQGLLVKGNTVADGAEYAFFLLTTGELYFRLDNGLGVFPAAIQTGITTGVWYHAVGTYNYITNIITLVVNNGTPIVVSSTVGGYNSSYPLYIGAAVSNDRPFDGIIDQIGFWKRKLTIAEISTLYNSGNGLSYAAMTSVASTDPRISQVATELISLAVIDPRVSQLAVELLSLPVIDPRVSQIATEILTLTTSVRTSQLAVELISLIVADPRVSQLSVELISLVEQVPRVSQLAIELISLTAVAQAEKSEFFIIAG